MYDEGHHNELGNALVAERIVSFVENLPLPTEISGELEDFSENKN